MEPLISTVLWNTIVAGSLASIVFLLQRFRALKRCPALSYFLWLVVLLKLVTPPLYSIPVLQGSTSRAAVETAGTSTEAGLAIDWGVSQQYKSADDDRSASWSMTYLSAIAAMSGSAILMIVCFVRTRRLSRLVRLAGPGPQWLQEMAADLAKQTGIRTEVTVRTVDKCVSPFLWASRHGPLVVVPSAMLDSFGRANLSLVLRHELIHYARRDHWINLFSMVVGCLLWWNPIAWWARRELRFAQELCCDAAVLAADHRQRRLYAETLLQTVDFVASDEATRLVPATAFGSCATFKRRIEMISLHDLSSRLSTVTRLTMLVLGALLIATSPGFAHDEDSKEELSRMRGEIRELRDAVSDLQSAISELTRRNLDDEDQRSEWEFKGREEQWLSRERLLKMAERADLNDREAETLLEISERVDGNPHRFGRLLFSDDLSEYQRHVMEKLLRDDDRETEHEDDESEGRESVQLTRKRLNDMAHQADLGPEEVDVLFELAEMVDFNGRQFERLTTSDDLREGQMRVLRKLMRDQDRRADREHEEREDREVRRLTREGLNRMAERTDLSEEDRDILFQLAEMVDMNARQFERLIYRDDLKDRQLRVLKKLARDDERREDRDEE